MHIVALPIYSDDATAQIIDVPLESTLDFSEYAENPDSSEIKKYRVIAALVRGVIICHINVIYILHSCYLCCIFCIIVIPIQ